MSLLSDLHSLGFCVVPAWSGTGTRKDKQPIIYWTPYQTARPSDDEIAQWSRSYPDCNALVITGAAHGIIVLDVDSDEGAEIVAERGVPDTVSVRTGKGVHFYFRHPGFHVKNREKFLPGLDLRGDGGYVVGAGSLHPFGHHYEWINHPDETPIADAPTWLLEEIEELETAPERPVDAARPTSPIDASIPPAERDAYNRRALDGELDKLRTWRGSRNRTLYRCAFNLGMLIAGNGLDQLTVVDALERAAAALDTNPDDPFTLREIRTTISSGLEDGFEKPRTMAPSRSRRPAPTPPPHLHDAPPPADADAPRESAPSRPSSPASDVVPPPDGTLPGDVLPEGPAHELTPDDIGNGQRFVEEWDGRIIYNHTHKTFMVWSGRHWTLDDTSHVLELAKITARRVLLETETLKDRNPKRRNALRLNNMRGLNAMLDAARSDRSVAILVRDLDRDPCRLNCLNGTLDLETADFRPHDPNDRISHLAQASYDPTAEAPLFQSLLRQCLQDDEETIGFLQAAAGYSASALTGEQCLLFNHGRGRNGKGTFIRALLHVLGTYGGTTPFETLLAKKHQSDHREDLARLVGTRFVAAGEPQKGRRFDETVVKTLTGEDDVTCRMMYGHFFTYRPTFKLWIHANDKPLIDGGDFAMQRRIRVIPWMVTIATPDPDLDKKLQTEASGILNWLVAGFRSYRERGLPVPATVDEASRKYFAETDPISSFAEECLDFAPDLVISQATIHATFQRWCKETGNSEMGLKWFKSSLERLGLTDVRRNYGRVWKGAALNENGSQIWASLSSSTRQMEATF